VTLEFPVLVMVTPCVAEEPSFTLPKAMLFVLNVRSSVAATPVPLKLITVGEPGALLTNEILPVTEPAADGWKTALNVLDFPAFTDNGRLSPLVLKPEPLTFACVIVSTPFPGLLTWNVWEFDEPTVTLPKFALVGVSVISA
jgi:hypothetical protein